MKFLGRNLNLSRFQADEHYQSALAAYTARDFKTARTEIQASIDLLPEHAEYHAALGYFRLEERDLPLAQDAFERALDLHPYEMLANYCLGLLAYREKNWKRAASFFTNALAAQPKRAETQFYMAMIHHRLGRNAEAIDWMQSAAAGFVRAGDQRERNCRAWISEFERLL
ncbi:MAG: tetratricopeptide repeat protein [Chloroflexi bacterium]|nr:tetratricopeptide repeat protein [Chloroflexota bacterium]